MNVRSGYLAKRAVRRALVLVLVAVVSGVAAYVVNGRNATHAAQRQPVVSDARPGFEAFATCLHQHGVTLPGPGVRPEGADVRAAFEACAGSLPHARFDGPRHGPR